MEIRNTAENVGKGGERGGNLNAAAELEEGSWEEVSLGLELRRFYFREMKSFSCKTAKGGFPRREQERKNRKKSIF